MQVESIDDFSISQFLACRRKFYWKIVENIVPRQASSPLNFGIAIHAALAEWHLSANVNKALDKFYLKWNDEQADLIRSTRTAENILNAYITKWSPEWFRVQEAETTFKIPLGDFDYSGRIDLTIQDKNDGRFLVVDHKTSSRTPSEAQQKTKYRQITGYIYAISELTGERCLSAIMNYIILTKEPKFIRVLSRRSLEQIEEWRDATQRIVYDIRQCVAFEDYYPNQMQCSAWGMCEYMPLCHAPDSVRANLIASQYATKQWNPMLEED